MNRFALPLAYAMRLDSGRRMFFIRSPWGRLGNGAGGDGACAKGGRIGDKPPMWLASVNAAFLGEYLDRETAMARVEADIGDNMKLVLHDWEWYREGKAPQT